MGETSIFQSSWEETSRKRGHGRKEDKQYQQEGKESQNPMEGTDLTERVSHGCDFQED